jgi:molecular chaperone GrpE
VPASGHDDRETGMDEQDAEAGDDAGWGTAVRSELAGLRAQVGREHDRAAAREQIIDRLHAENQSLRAGERQLLLRPLLTDLQRLRHELIRQADRLPAQFSAAQAAELLRSYAYNLELTLERGGIAVLLPEPGAAFDPSLHRAVGTVPVDDPGRNARVAEVVLDGYRDVESGRVVTPTEVRVHRWVPPEPDAAAVELPATEPEPETAHSPS